MTKKSAEKKFNCESGCEHGGDIYRHPGVIDFSSNMNPLGTPESVIKAGQEAMRLISRYPDPRAEELREAVAKSEGVPPEKIVFGNGAAELILMWAMAVRPSHTLIAVPTFSEYEHAIHKVFSGTDTGCASHNALRGPCTGGSDFDEGRHGSEYIPEEGIDYYSLREETGFVLDDDFAGRITEKTDAVVLCNPNNPTGILIPPDVLHNIIRKCRRLHVNLLLDECFLDFCEEGKKRSVVPELAAFPELVILKAFTKKYAMAGIRLGYALCGSSCTARHIREMTQPWNVSLPAQAAGIAALKENEYLRKSSALISGEREFLKGGLETLGLKVYDSSADYVFFKGRPGLCHNLLKKGILIRDCGNYRGLSEGFYRAAVRKHEDNEKLLTAVRDTVFRVS